MGKVIAEFIDILEPKRREMSTIISFMQEHYSQEAYKQTHKPKADIHKENVIECLKSQEIFIKLSKMMNLSKEPIEEKMKLILGEIGFNKDLNVIRFLGIILTKICVQTCSTILVHHGSLLHVKSLLGETPLVFVPSHRSYADFILMSYVMYTYKIAIPITAAGIDFHGMRGLGKILRDTGAFFMRRSYSEDGLYWMLFRQYIHQIVTSNDAPVQFFLEGTRSRTGKSLMSKYGLLSMILKPLFTSEVPDILFVPVGIAYDRVLEEKLFANELLGIPKPQESTSGFFKSLDIIYEKYGNIYFNFGTPISSKKYFDKKIDKSVHNLRPLHSPLEERIRQHIPEFASDIIRKQQELCIITPFNLIALYMTENFIQKNDLLTLKSVIKEVVWYRSIFEKLDVQVNLHDIEWDIRKAIYTHKNLVQLDENTNIISLVCNQIKLSDSQKSQLTAHSLQEKTMSLAVPFIMLQLYVNPTLHVLIDSMLVMLIVAKSGADLYDKGKLSKKFEFLRCFFAHDFVFCKRDIYQIFEKSILHLVKLDVLHVSEAHVALGQNRRLLQVLINLIIPFIVAYNNVILTLKSVQISGVEENFVLTRAQEKLEIEIQNMKNDFIHPYVLSLDTLKNCLHSLVDLGAVARQNLREGTYYVKNTQALQFIGCEIEQLLEEKWSFDVPTTLRNKL